MELTDLVLIDIEADYGWDSPGIIRIGEKKDIAAYLGGDCSGKCVIFCHGNGETAISERYWFNRLTDAGVSVICPDYRGYGLTEGKSSENGCYEVAHAAYDFLRNEKGVRGEDIFVIGYSLGSAIAVELAATQTVGGLILEAAFYNGYKLSRFWLGEDEMLPVDGVMDRSFPTSSRLLHIHVPALVIHGTCDDVVPYSQGESVFNRLPSNDKTFVPVEDAGHCDFQRKLGDKYIPLLLDFISSK